MGVRRMSPQEFVAFLENTDRLRPLYEVLHVRDLTVDLLEGSSPTLDPTQFFQLQPQLLLREDSSDG